MTERKQFAVLLLAISAAGAVFQWYQILYRLKLFLVNCGCRLHVNHIGEESVFVFVAIAEVVLVGLGIIGALLLWRDSKGKAWVLVPTIVNLAGALAILIMRVTGVLCTYGDYIRHRAVW